MRHYKSIEQFKEEFYTKFPEKKESLKILDYGNKQLNILVEDEFGKCLMNRSNLSKGDNPSLQTAIDKLSYYKNMFYKKFPNSEIEILKFSDKETKQGYKGYIIINTNQK